MCIKHVLCTFFSQSGVEAFEGEVGIVGQEVGRYDMAGELLWDQLLEPELPHFRLQDVPVFLVPGVNVAITIFCEFRQFSAKQLSFVQKINVHNYPIGICLI
jgi:hypothetical protein